MGVGKIEFNEKRCYSFEDFKELEKRVEDLEAIIEGLVKDVTDLMEGGIW